MKAFLKLATVAALLILAAAVHTAATDTSILASLQTWGAIGSLAVASIIDLDFTSLGTARAAAPQLRSAFHGIDAVADITVETFFPKSLRAKCDAFNALAEKSRQSRAQFDANREKTMSESVRSIELTNDLCGFGRDIFVTILQHEMELRELYGKIEEQIHAAILAEADEALQLVKDTEATLIEGLLQIGYLPMENGAPVVGSYVPDFLNRHLAIRAARDNAVSLRSRTASRDAAIENYSQIEKLIAAISKIRDRALAVAN